ncbi:hypothetical protein C0993_008521 [Termitomyces sp. T159_Od127]|nr:hypothetical protein C0993_008521 [Termitomyces sp. T159_Od127]
MSSPDGPTPQKLPEANQSNSSQTLVEEERYDDDNDDNDNDEYIPSEDDEEAIEDNPNITEQVLQDMYDFDPSSKEGVIYLKNVRAALEEAFLGYCLVYATSEDHFGTAPRIRRNVVNPRVPNDKDLDVFYRATHRGVTLDPLNVKHAVSIGVYPQSYSGTFASDPAQATFINYHSEYHGKVYGEEKKKNSKYAKHIPILLDGGHRYDLMQRRIYFDALIQYRHAILQLEGQKLGSVPEDSPNAIFWRGRYKAALATAKEGKWLARVYNMSTSLIQVEYSMPINIASVAGMIAKSEYRSQLLLLLCANTPTHRTTESETTHLVMISNILNNSKMNASQSLMYYVKYQLNPTDSMNARIRGALSNERLTFALAGLLRIDFFRAHPAMLWNINQIYKWQRCALSILTPYIEWTSLAFDILASTNELALTEPFPTGKSTITYAIKKAINAKLERFMEQPFSMRQVCVDVFNAEFFCIILDVWHKRLEPLAHMFGTVLTGDTANTYSQAWEQYQEDILHRLFTWIEARKAEVKEDPELEKVLDLMPDRLRWIIKGQVATGFRIPLLFTNSALLMPSMLTPLITSLSKIEESLIIVLSQFDSMASYELRTDRHYSPSNLTYLDIIEACHNRARRPPVTGLDLRCAVSHFIGLLIEHRYTTFEHMRALNGGGYLHPENPPAYIARITKGKTKEPALSNAINAIASIIKSYTSDKAKGISDEQWKQLSGGDDCIPTSRRLLQRAITKTASNWMKVPKAKVGNPNRTNHLTTIATWLFLSTHAVHSCSVEPDYKGVGYEAPYFSNENVFDLVTDLCGYFYDEENPDAIGFKTWHERVEPESTAESLTTAIGPMPMQQANVASASTFLSDVYRFLQRSEMFSFDLIESNTSTHCLTAHASRLMDSLVEFVKHGLVDYHRDEVMTAQQTTHVTPLHVAAICQGLVIPPYKKLAQPTTEQERTYFSADNLQKIRMTAETRTNSAVTRKIQRIIGTDEKPQKRGRDSGMLVPYCPSSASQCMTETATTAKPKRGVGKYPFIDLRTKITPVKKRRARKLLPSELGSISKPIIVDSDLEDESAAAVQGQPVAGVPGGQAMPKDDHPSLKRPREEDAALVQHVNKSPRLATVQGQSVSGVPGGQEDDHPAALVPHVNNRSADSEENPSAPQILVPPSSDTEEYPCTPIDQMIMEYGTFSD